MLFRSDDDAANRNADTKALIAIFAILIVYMALMSVLGFLISSALFLFATHYHELNEMEKSFKRIKNYNVSVKEIDNKVIFLRKLERGGSEHSFGIHVAKMAGMPKSIVKRAADILKQLETDNRQQGVSSKPMAEVGETRGGMQLSFFQLDDPILCQIRDEILNLDVNNLTPLEALNKLNDIKRIVKGK